MQLCPDCRYLYHSESRLPCCMCCDSTHLSIPCSENTVEIVNSLLDRGIKVVSASCDIHDLVDYIDGKVVTGKSVQIQIELGYLYDDLFIDPPLPPDWLVYEYSPIINHRIGPKHTGLSHSQDFIPLDSEELEFATALTISNLELWVDSYDKDGFKSVLKLGGYEPDQ